KSKHGPHPGDHRAAPRADRRYRRRDELLQRAARRHRPHRGGDVPRGARLHSEREHPVRGPAPDPGDKEHHRNDPRQERQTPDHQPRPDPRLHPARQHAPLRARLRPFLLLPAAQPLEQLHVGVGLRRAVEHDRDLQRPELPLRRPDQADPHGNQDRRQRLEPEHPDDLQAAHGAHGLRRPLSLRVVHPDAPADRLPARAAHARGHPDRRPGRHGRIPARADLPLHRLTPLRPQVRPHGWQLHVPDRLLPRPLAVILADDVPAQLSSIRRRIPQVVKFWMLGLVVVVCLALARGVPAEIRPGMTLDQATAEEAKDLLPPEILSHYKQGEYPNAVCEFPNSCFPWDDGFAEASEWNRTNLILDANKQPVDKATGKRPDYLTGRPFPDIRDDDPDAGYKVLWNTIYVVYNGGNSRNVTSLNWLSPSGLDRSSTQDVTFLYYDGQPK